MYNSKKIIESFTFYEEKLLDLGEWLKQLFAESHGKEQKGICRFLPYTAGRAGPYQRQNYQTAPRQQNAGSESSDASP